MGRRFESCRKPALPISIIFYLISIYIVLVTKKIKYFKDKYNLILLICTGIMIFCSLSSALFIEEFNANEKENIFINLFNWIPFFILFICSNFYLNNPEKKKNIFKVLNCKYSSDNFKLYFTILVWHTWSIQDIKMD